MEKRNWIELARGLAPAKWKKIDHPMGSEGEARELLASLPVTNPLASLNEVLHWLESVAAEAAFSPELRARIVLLLDQTARPHWRSLAQEFLAPDGQSAEGKDGDPNLLRRFAHVAGALAQSYREVFRDDIPLSDWTRRNAALLLSRWVHALAQRTALHWMLREPADPGLWTTLNGVLERASHLKADQALVAAHDGDKRLTCVRQEYLRTALFSIATPESLRMRDLELMFRIAGRFAASVQLVGAPVPDCAFGIDLRNASGPVAVERLPREGRVRFLDTRKCIAQMSALANPGGGGAGATLYTHFGNAFTARERSRMLRHAFGCWGPKPPKRRTNRIRMDESVLITTGLIKALDSCEIYEQGGFGVEDSGLRIEFDDKQRADKLAAERLRRERAATLKDASTSGLGLSLPRADTSWARVGALVSVLIGSGPDWAVCAARRVAPGDDTLTLGVELLTRRSRSAWLRVLARGNESVWDESLLRERNFDSHFVRAMLLTDLPRTEADFGEMLLPAGSALPGVSFDLPLPGQVLRLSVVDVSETGDDYVRVRVRWHQTLRADTLA